jgi:hypothetical protein
LILFQNEADFYFVCDSARKQWSDGDIYNVKAYERGLLAHNEHVRAAAGDRLLEWEASQGWEPLCKFLGKAIPDEPFPRINERGATTALLDWAIYAHLVNSMRRVGLQVGVPLVIAVAAYGWMTRA